METPLVSSARCSAGHPIEIVAEGYGVCYGEQAGLWTPWRFTPPGLDDPLAWTAHSIYGADGREIDAWVGYDYQQKEHAIAAITADIALHRCIPFDEARERARLMPV